MQARLAVCGAVALGVCLLYLRRRRRSLLLAPAPVRIGIDCGGVICMGGDTDDAGKRGDLRASVMRSEPSSTCVRAVRAIIQRYGAENVFILSKCGYLTQCATVIMLNKFDFFRATGLRPHNVLFCTERHGGGELTEAQMEPLTQPPEAAGAFVDQLQHWPQLSMHEAPRVAPGRVGKGAVAAAFGLTTLIDDRAECLGSFYAEGPLHTAPARGLLVHFGVDPTKQTVAAVKSQLKSFKDEWERGLSERYRPALHWEAVEAQLLPA